MIRLRLEKELIKLGELELKSNQAGNPAAPRGTHLPLLPFGPDGVRKFLPRRTHPATQD